MVKLEQNPDFSAPLSRHPSPPVKNKSHDGIVEVFGMCGLFLLCSTLRSTGNLPKKRCMFMQVQEAVSVIARGKLNKPALARMSSLTLMVSLERWQLIRWFSTSSLHFDKQITPLEPRDGPHFFSYSFYSYLRMQR